MKHPAPIATIFLIVLLCGTGQVSGYTGEDYSKILVLHMNISKNTVREDSVEMQDSVTPRISAFRQATSMVP